MLPRLVTHLIPNPPAVHFEAMSEKVSVYSELLYPILKPVPGFKSQPIALPSSTLNSNGSTID
jgi:hypothetical protein